MPGVTVTLVAAGNTKSVGLIAVTGEDGKFQVITPQGGKGAPEGSYKVVLTKPVEVDYANPGKGPAATKDIPKEYQSAQSTSKIIDVTKSGPNVIEIQL